jgi:hypothetical protein
MHAPRLARCCTLHSLLLLTLHHHHRLLLHHGRGRTASPKRKPAVGGRRLCAKPTLARSRHTKAGSSSSRSTGRIFRTTQEIHA